MNDKIVTREDLDVLRALREATCTGSTCTCPGSNLLDRLIAAAEAAQPPLPEGWVLAEMNGDRFPYWHHDGRLYQGVGVEGKPLTPRDRVGSHNRAWLTPLRPTVSEADVEKAARAARAAYFNGVDAWDAARQGARGLWMKTARAAIDALGIEVQS